LLIIPAALIGAYVVCLARLPMPQRLTPAEVLAGVHSISIGWLRICGGLLVVMLGLTLAASRPEPEVDAEINEAIDAEAPGARRNALSELKFLTPAILLAVTAALVLRLDSVSEPASQILHWRPVGHWQPVLGLATGLAGWVIGGAIGWATRIVFTLIFGKEAFGLGDVHILAAIGAVAGWPVVLIGFFLAAPLTLVALLLIQLWPAEGRVPYVSWAMVAIFAASLAVSHVLFIAAAAFTLLIILFVQMRRQSRALPYGPWLALGCLIASIYQDQLIMFLRTRGLFG
jgi:prepilin signal peptidase PulO-like enzyme (type II secretory pathway)